MLPNIFFRKQTAENKHIKIQFAQNKGDSILNIFPGIQSQRLEFVAFIANKSQQKIIFSF